MAKGGHLQVGAGGTLHSHQLPRGLSAWPEKLGGRCSQHSPPAATGLPSLPRLDGTWGGQVWPSRAPPTRPAHDLPCQKRNRGTVSPFLPKGRNVHVSCPASPEEGETEPENQATASLRCRVD